MEMKKPHGGQPRGIGKGACETVRFLANVSRNGQAVKPSC